MPNPKARIRVQLKSNAIKQFLQSREVENTLEKLGDDIAQETQSRYSSDGKAYEFKAESLPSSDRARIVIVSRDGDPVRYSEAARGHLLDAVNKKREAR